jgi:hypothetical protein
VEVRTATFTSRVMFVRASYTSFSISLWAFYILHICCWSMVIPLLFHFHEVGKYIFTRLLCKLSIAYALTQPGVVFI